MALLTSGLRLKRTFMSILVNHHSIFVFPLSTPPPPPFDTLLHPHSKDIPSREPLLIKTPSLPSSNTTRISLHGSLSPQSLFSRNSLQKIHALSFLSILLSSTGKKFGDERAVDQRGKLLRRVTIKNAGRVIVKETANTNMDADVY